MENVSLTIDGIKVEVPRGSTVLEAARKIGVDRKSVV
jgi:NADH dehydrogenase/NADH:ubiquinone oxidoreductase subunit G